MAINTSGNFYLRSKKKYLQSIINENKSLNYEFKHFVKINKNLSFYKRSVSDRILFLFTRKDIKENF